MGSTGVMDREGELQLEFCCSLSVALEDWFWGYREKRGEKVHVLLTLSFGEHGLQVYIFISNFEEIGIIFF